MGVGLALVGMGVGHSGVCVSIGPPSVGAALATPPLIPPQMLPTMLPPPPPPPASCPRVVQAPRGYHLDDVSAPVGPPRPPAAAFHEPPSVDYFLTQSTQRSEVCVGGEGGGGRLGGKKGGVQLPEWGTV